MSSDKINIYLIQDSLVMFGGKLENGQILNEIWSFDMISMQWSVLSVNATLGTQIPGLIGHSAHVTKTNNGSNIMLVFFGYSEELGVSNFVFELDLGKYFFIKYKCLKPKFMMVFQWFC